MSGIDLNLTSQQRGQLCAQLQSARDAGLYRRTLALLSLDQGQSISDVSKLLHVGRSSVYRWIDRYRHLCHVAALEDHRGQGRPSVLTEKQRLLLCSALKQSPQRYGYLATGWTVPLLQDSLGRVSGQRVSEDTIRRQLHACGYAWKRFRYVLAADPDLEKKTANFASNQGFAASHRGAGRR